MTEPTIKPTVGRVMWYYPSRTHMAELGLSYDDYGKPLAAIVAAVVNDRCVNLAAFDQRGVQFSVFQVIIIETDPAPESVVGYAAWMPYQKGQAARTEAAGAAVHAVDGKASIDPSMVKLLLEKGTVVHLRGIPVELDCPSVIQVHAGNVPLIYGGAVDACKASESS